MKHAFVAIITLFAVLLFFEHAFAATAGAKSSDEIADGAAKITKQSADQCTIAVTLNDSIGAATVDTFQRLSEKALLQKCNSILVRINTPGGHLQSTRMITEHILASKIPFLCLISPAGGHAGSAGAIILQACHIAGGLTATNVGAATPILGNGENIPADLRNKMINDTVSWVEGLALLRGRSQDFAKKIVTEGLAVTAEEAVKMKAMNFATVTEKEFLDRAQGVSVLVDDKRETKVVVGVIKEFELDARYKILQFVSEPEWAYMLFLGALLLLYAEFSHPGLFLPGVTGAILLVLSLVSFNKLDANMGATALMLLGLAFWVAELFITSKGILGVAGTVAFLIGSFLLFDEESGFSIPIRMILSAGFVFGGMSAGLAYLAAKTLNRPKQDYDNLMKTAKLEILELSADQKSGQVRALGEIWSFESPDSISKTDEVEVVERSNLKLILKKKFNS